MTGTPRRTTGPAVSIVLPTFNRLKHLRPAVDSVFAQTLTDWELIIADDGSEGETAAYLETLAPEPQVRVLRLPHTGNLSSLRNAAWQAAAGEYIAFLDSDDVWLPEKLAAQVASLDRHPDRGWSHTAFAVIDEAGQLLTGAQARWWPATEGWILEGLIKMATVVAIPSVMVRRRLLEQVGGFDLTLRVCEDYDLWLRLAGLSAVDGVPETLLYKRTHRESYYNDTMVLEARGRALEKVLRSGSPLSLHSTLRRERAKLAAHVARNQAFVGSRWAAFRTLARSSHYSWGYPEWWLGGAHAAARAMAPASFVRIARAVVRRGAGR
jgi:glycosyltransferase involved in cell wall biosynthesis